MSYEIPLVLEIQKRPCLYNFNLPEYNRKDCLEKVWAEIAATVNLTVYECKDKWKNIRSSFVRSLRSHGGKLKKPYYLTQYLQFLLPYLKPINIDDDSQLQTYSSEIGLHENLTETFTIKLEPPDNSEIMDPLQSVMEKEQTPLKRNGGHAQKRKRQVAVRQYNVQQRNKIKRQNVTLARENNATKYFLLSLLPELDTMDDDQIRLFKIKVMMLIDEIKSDDSKVREELPDSSENARLQKRLINLLLKNLKKDLEIAT